MAAAFGDRRIDVVRASDLEALRAFYNRAVPGGYVTTVGGPAHRIRKPRRSPNTRRSS